MTSTTFWVSLVAVLIVIGAFLLSGLFIMWLTNVVLGHYDIKLLDYPTSLAIAALVWIYGGARRASEGR